MSLRGAPVAGPSLRETWTTKSLRARVSTVITLFSWLLAGALLLIEVLRLLGLDAYVTVLIAISTAWPVIVLSGLLVCAGAAYLRELKLATAATLVLVVIVSAWWPAWTGTVGPGAPGAPGLRVLALNVEYTADTGAGVTRQVRSQNPDVIVLSELSPLTLRRLDLSQYQYRWMQPERNAFGEGVWSRWPIADATTWSVAGLDMVRLTVNTPSGPLRVYQVHTIAPRGPKDRASWRAQLKQLRDYLSGETHPVIAAGDFNASRWDGSFAQILGGPRHIADAGQGHGYLATWPNGHVVPPFLSLDHVLISGGMGVRSFRVLGPVGSDHRAIVTDLTLPVSGATVSQ